MVNARLVCPPLLMIFSETSLVDCIEKVDAIFVVGLRSRLGCDRELDPHFVRFNTLSKNYNAWLWGTY
jgi:hypothetical protein